MHVFCTDLDGKVHELQATEEWSLMEIIREGGLPILAQCGGSCACAACHVYIDPEWKSKIPEAQDEELGMLDGAFEVTTESRLSCQVFFTKELDGMKFKLAPGSL